MLFGRILGWCFLIAAAIVLARDGLAFAHTHNIAPETLGGLWFDLNSESLRVAESGIEHLAPWLWTYAAAPLLFLWAAPSLAAIAAVLLFLCRRTHTRWFR